MTPKFDFDNQTRLTQNRYLQQWKQPATGQDATFRYDATQANDFSSGNTRYQTVYPKMFDKNATNVHAHTFY